MKRLSVRSHTVMFRLKHFRLRWFWFRREITFIVSPHWKKAVCDKLYTVSPTANTKELYALLADDLRIDMDARKKLDQSKLAQLSGKYHSTNVKKLCSLIRRL